MIWIIIGSIPLVIFIIETVKSWSTYNKRRKENVYVCKEDMPLEKGWIFAGVIALALTGIMIWFIGSTFSGMILYKFKGNTEEYYTSWNITAMQDNLNTHGRFYIRRGYIETDLCYYYTYPTKNGLKSGYIPANKTYLNYTTDKPHIERYSRRWNKSWIKWFTYLDAQDCTTYSTYSTDDVYYKVYVPEGSVEQSFNIDLQ